MRRDGVRWPKYKGVIYWAAALAVAVSMTCFIAPVAQAADDDALEDI